MLPYWKGRDTSGCLFILLRNLNSMKMTAILPNFQKPGEICARLNEEVEKGELVIDCSG